MVSNLYGLSESSTDGQVRFDKKKALIHKIRMNHLFPL